MYSSKNYSSCPLKKRPVPVISDDETGTEPEQDEPVNLCINKPKLSESVVNPRSSARMFSSSPPRDMEMPLRDITTMTHQRSAEQFHASLPAMRYETIGKLDSVSSLDYSSHQSSLYNQFPGYTYVNPQVNSTLHRSSPMAIKCEPVGYSPYSPREYSISPPAHIYSTSAIAPQVPPQISRTEYFNNNKNSNHNVIRTSIKAEHRYMPYHQPAPLSPGHNSLNSVGSPRSSMSPASTDSVSEDIYQRYQSRMVATKSPSLYHLHHHSNNNNNHIDSAELSDPAAISNESTPRYKCTECGKSYSTYSGLTKHIQFHCPAIEGNQAKKSYDCTKCGKQNKSVSALKMHIRTHTLPNKCHICGKAFSRPWLLQGHIRTHTGEKPFSCQYCHRAFADRSNLRAHLQTHSDVKKYSCTSCDKTFSRMSLLTKHSEGGCPGVHHHEHDHHHHLTSQYMHHPD